MSHLLREHAPITETAWRTIDEEARGRLTPALAARKLVDFAGPYGWEHSATNLGRTHELGDPPGEGVTGLQRRVLPVTELRSAFSIALDDLRDVDRGARDVDLGSLDEAARRLASAENGVVFHGWEGAGIVGIAQAAPYDPIVLGEAFDQYPRLVANAVELLLDAGIEGPYGLALDPNEHARVLGASEQGGYPLVDHLRKILGGPVVRSPGLSGGVVVSVRGGDFLFDSGEDISIGYARDDAQTVDLYLVESFTFRVVTPEAAVPLAPSA